MSEQEKEQPKVTVDDVVEVLAKHAGTPIDPDDADTITRFNQQVAEDKEKKQSGPESKAPSSAKGRP
jgi:hypothetical protein